jgi:hypothetical protein
MFQTVNQNQGNTLFFICLFRQFIYQECYADCLLSTVKILVSTIILLMKIKTFLIQINLSKFAKNSHADNLIDIGWVGIQT